MCASELLGGVIEDVDPASGGPHDLEGNHCRGRLPHVAENRILAGEVGVAQRFLQNGTRPL
jgi:hypothetical protein